MYRFFIEIKITKIRKVIRKEIKLKKKRTNNLLYVSLLIQKFDITCRDKSIIFIENKTKIDYSLGRCGKCPPDFK